MLNFFRRRSALQDLLFLSALSSFFLLFKLGSGSLASRDEALYATVAKGVFYSRDLFRLTLDGAPWADKPPFCIWATAFCYQLFGVNEFAARFFSAFCGIGTVLVTYLLGRACFGRWVGFLGAGVLLSSVHFFRFARLGMMDAPLAFFLTLALFFFWIGRDRNRYLIFSGLSLGLAVMVKGPAAFLFFPITWLYAFLGGEAAILGRSSYWIGLMLAVGIALPWHLFETFTQYRLFMKDAVIKHLVEHTARPLESHSGNAFFYIRTIVNKYHPWILVAILSGPFFVVKSIRERTGETLFFTLWMFVVLLVMTLVQTKLAWFIYPLYPALSISVGYLLAKVLKEDERNWVCLMFIVIMSLHVFYSGIFAEDYSPGIKAAAPSVLAETLKPDEPVFLYNYRESPAVSFYIGRLSRILGDEASLVSEAAARSHFVCLIRTKDWEGIEGRVRGRGLRTLGRFDNLTLLGKGAR